MFPWNMFPFNEEMSQLMKNIPLPHMDEQMKQALSQWKQWSGALKGQGEHGQQPATGGSSFSSEMEVFETFDFIFIRVPIREKTWLSQLKILHTSHKAILKNIPEQGEERVIPLPSPVLRKGTAAKYRDGILEIRFIKKAENEITEVGIDF
ncbi:hypothetical protein BpJC7_23890 [Weizmannia acidilactici]|uniref:Uncharacterized protein n=1 Tax=Weizmannia acidilactici TaxID=2607726 RepID=A0A5J4J866_9BACI|nr:HSP20-like chaperone [Weizmannia acidilactici]GER68247.1 hypothetical protein BpJC4_27180 [Weizmannia acidilactici]GER71086.1 hypothetical protein BpJC7_23890 [Weizmannia acidilactici]GER74532.1 hypothetical protein BpPP18_25990 [Weizmannia acidilactici]